MQAVPQGVHEVAQLLRYSESMALQLVQRSRVNGCSQPLLGCEGLGEGGREGESEQAWWVSWRG